jgi:hypothetical protein
MRRLIAGVGGAEGMLRYDDFQVDCPLCRCDSAFRIA